MQINCAFIKLIIANVLNKGIKEKSNKTKVTSKKSEDLINSSDNSLYNNFSCNKLIISIITADIIYIL